MWFVEQSLTLICLPVSYSNFSCFFFQLYSFISKLFFSFSKLSPKRLCSRFECVNLLALRFNSTAGAIWVVISLNELFRMVSSHTSTVSVYPLLTHTFTKKASSVLVFSFNHFLATDITDGLHSGHGDSTTWWQNHLVIRVKESYGEL